MKWIRNDYKGNPQVWYSGKVIEKIKPVLELYANSWVDPEVYKGLHFDAEPAKRALNFLNEVDND